MASDYSLHSQQLAHCVGYICSKFNAGKEYAGEKLGFYQLLKRDGKGELRVQTGRIGFVKQYEDLNDKELNEILDFCKKRRFIQISEHVRDEEFFK